MFGRGAAGMHSRHSKDDEDDRAFATVWLYGAALCHAFNLLPIMGLRFGSAGLPQTAFLAVSAISLVFICVWSLACLQLHLGGEGRRTALGVVLMLGATAAIAIVGPEGSGVRRMMIANGIAAFAMLGRTFPFGPLDGLFASRPARLRRTDDLAA